MNKGVLMIISGPSGAGKGTVVQQLVERSDEIFLSISATTRAPRTSEIPNQHYYFVSRDEFQDMIHKNELLEYAEYAGNFYGTPAKAVEQMLNNGKHVILEIDIQGGKQIRQSRPDVVLVFLIPPTMEELEARLRGRGTESEEIIQKRLAIAAQEYRNIKDYDYVVTNDTIDHAVKQLQAILTAERCSTKRIPIQEIGLKG